MAEVRIKASDARRKPKPGETALRKHANRQKRRPRQPTAPPIEEDEEDSEPDTEVIVQGGETPDIHTWPTRAEAARRIGVNKRTIMRWQKDGDLEAVIDEKGFFRFNPEDIDELAASRTGEAAQMMGQSVAMVVQTSTDLTGKAQAHAQAFADKHLQQSDIAFDRILSMSETLREENNSLRLYIRELEGDRVEARKKIEAAESKVHERSLAELEVTTRERRLDWAIGTFIQLAGPSIAMKLGLDVKNIPPLPGLGTVPGIAPTGEAPTQELPTGGLSEPKGVGPIGTNDPATTQDLVRLETNCIMLIGNIEEDRIKMLCRFSKPNEGEALMEIWNTVQRLRKQAQAAKPEEKKN